jgi:hypothetical protein
VAAIANSNASQADLANEFAATLSGSDGFFDEAGAAGLHAAAIGWLIVGLIGVVLLIIGIAIRAAGPRDASVPDTSEKA